MSRKDLTSYTAKVAYRKHPGTWMYLFHRISGITLGLYFVSHMLGIANICSFLGDVARTTPLVAAMSILFCLHTANGVRIILMEFCSSADRDKFLPHLMIALAIGLLLSLIIVIKFIMVSKGGIA